MRNESSEVFRAARNFLLAHREDYTTAREKFQWPALTEFNWALDWFDVIAWNNDFPALRIVEEDGTERCRSFSELSQRSARVANWLRNLGVRRGDRVLLMLGNQVELWETILAAIKLGP
jgi:acetyl-CoA synthetase